MNNLLIGSRGFVGTNLADNKSLKISHKAGKKEIKELAGKEFDNIYCAAPQAKKWLANKQPDFDLSEIKQLIQDIKKITCNKKIILFSTIDIYNPAIEVDEDTPLEGTIHPYGNHRRILEYELRKIYKDRLLSIRLPALIGKNLKKNIIYDLINENEIEKINQNSSFQWFNLNYIHNIIKLGIQKNIQSLNLATEPINTSDIVKIFFPEYQKLLKMEKDGNSVKYDMWSKHTNNKTKYFYSREVVLRDHLKKFISDYI